MSNELETWIFSSQEQSPIPNMHKYIATENKRFLE